MSKSQVVSQPVEEGENSSKSRLFPLRTRDDTTTQTASEVVMAEPTFETFVAKERDRLIKSREDALSKRAEIDEQIKTIETELGAIDAYEAAKTGKSPGSRKRGTRRSGRRNEVLEAVKKHANGINRGDLLQAMGAKGDRSEEQSISNALSALKRAEKITQDDEGRYRVPDDGSSGKTTTEAVARTPK